MNNKKIQQGKLEKIRTDTLKAFGEGSSALGNETYELNVVPSPSLMLDYKLGKGGFPYGAMVEIFGSNKLGKTTVLGYGTIANVQKQGKLPALIAMEPHAGHQTVGWAKTIHPELDPDLIVYQYPNNVHEAFDMLYDLVYNSDIDYIVLDSIGAMAHEFSLKDGAKKKAYGVSGEVTDGLNKIMPKLYKTNKGLMIINQQRQAGQASGMTFYDSPGGEGLKHHALIRIQLKPGKERYYSTIEEQKQVQVGRELICKFAKNKMAQADGKEARFDFFSIASDEYGPPGIDRVADVVRTGKITGVIKSQGSWLQHPVFPKEQVQGLPKARVFFRESPAAFDVIREQVMAVMIREEIEAKQKTNLEAVA